MTLLFAPFALRAQDTTQAYPWRLSYFPYLTASPNDGVMAMGRVLFFRQSRWEDRVSLRDGVAIEGGYSTKDAWLARVRGDFPRIADGWRVQVSAQAERTPRLGTFQEIDLEGVRQATALEVTRKVAGPLLVAIRGKLTHSGVRFYDARYPVDNAAPRLYEMDRQVRAAAVVDLRDREFDTRRGALIQAGIAAGHFDLDYRGSSFGEDDYHGWYGLAAGWLPLSAATTVTGRLGARSLSAGAFNGIETERTLPAWEDDLILFGGPESNRGLPQAAVMGRGMLLASGEVRHQLFTAPGVAVSLIGFVDAGRAFFDEACIRTAGSSASAPSNAVAACGSSGDLQATLAGWTVAPGGGVSLRLLRNAILTATIARGEGATRVYVSSGWSW